jgi:uncharacterized protein (TIGR03382 family)
MKVLVATFALALGALGTLAPSLALAQVAPPAPPASEALVLQGDIQRYAAETEGADCATACRALDSMRRAADRICEIEPGDGCARAEDTLRKTAARVRAACPECAAAQGARSPAGTVSVPPVVTPPAAPPPNAAETEAVQRKGGGCAGCTTSGHEEGAPFLFLLAAAAVLAARRRRRRRTRARRRG